jgi:hypothetical protein
MDIMVGIHEIAVKSGPLISKARNEIVGAFLDGLPDSEHLLMVDTDIQFYPQDVEKLMKADRPIISGLYTGLNTDGSPFPVGSKRINDKLERLTWEDLPKSGITTVVACGMGFCLIKREVLEALAGQRKERRLWPFQELEMDGQAMGEDITFCIRAEAFGFQTYLDVDVPVGHVKTATIMPPGYGEER